jgi:myo-inositol-1(or 4)-monophosphatase
MELEKLLVDTAKQAGIYIRNNAFDFGNASWKKKDDPVTILDKNAEKLIRALITLADPKANFIGEEYGLENNGGELTWIIDPIDGTKSFIRGDFLAATSIGVEKNGILTGGVVYDFMRDMMYVATGNDAKMLFQGKTFPLGKNQVMSKKYVLHDYLRKEEYARLDVPEISLRQHVGSIALELAQLANGNYEAAVFGDFNKRGFSSWDVAGGVALLKANGYKLTDVKGNPYNYHEGNKGLIAAKPEFSAELFKLLGIKE